MSEITPKRVALAGNPNCGKTVLFNALTGQHQRVGNYPGVTVEYKEGWLGSAIQIFDLPGAYSLDGRTPDEVVTRDVLNGMTGDWITPHLIVAVTDATQLERQLAFILELRTLKKPMILVVNMLDLARKRELELNLRALEDELGFPVVAVSGVTGEGIPKLIELVRENNLKHSALPSDFEIDGCVDRQDAIRRRFIECDRIYRKITQKAAKPAIYSARLDRIIMHPLWGSLFLSTLFIVIFQAVFGLAALPQQWLELGVKFLIDSFTAMGGNSLPMRIVTEGILPGVGGVLVFLPQILFLFLFLQILEESGYMARAAFLMDRIMGFAGLHGRAFIPLLSSCGCSVTGIFATRSIENPRDRLLTILVSPFMTCSARLPVYTLLIAAFIPNIKILGPLHLQGLMMFALYMAGILSALGVAWLLRKTLLKGPRPSFLMELPNYNFPRPKVIARELLWRSTVFIKRAGTVILAFSLLLWVMVSFPSPPSGNNGSTAATHPAIETTIAGTVGRAIEPLIRPIGFDWRIGVSLIPAMAAREVLVSSLATVYAVEKSDDEEKTAEALSDILKKNWSLPTALSLLMWFVLSCQCVSTLSAVKSETRTWKWPIFIFVMMTCLAYIACFITYHVALWWV